MQTDVIILGGGASGLAACAALADTGLRIALVERLDRVGKKLLSTGNGRCNLSNVDMNPAYYAEAAPFVSQVYEKTPPKEVMAFFSSLGLMTTSEDGRIYPRTMSSSSVLDVLRAGIDRDSVQVLCGQEAARLSPPRPGRPLHDGRQRRTRPGYGRHGRAAAYRSWTRGNEALSRPCAASKRPPRDQIAQGCARAGGADA